MRPVVCPLNHDLKNIFGIVVGQCTADGFDDTLRRNFLIPMKQCNDDVKQTQLDHLLGKDCLSAYADGDNKRWPSSIKRNSSFSVATIYGDSASPMFVIEKPPSPTDTASYSQPILAASLGE